MQRQLDDDVKPYLKAYAVPPYALHWTQMVTEMEAWEDVPDEIDIPAHEVDPSNEGGEYFHFIDMAQDSLARKHERVSIHRQAWEVQLPALFTAFMTYKFGPPPNAPNVVNATFFDISFLGTQGYDAARSLPHNQGHDHLNKTLIIHGFLGTAPAHPTLAIPIPTLELYHRCQLCCPQLSIQQWVKILCDLANIYSQAIRDQFLDAFDTYLDILCQVDQAIKLAREAELNPSMMGVLDGNNSLKWFVRKDRRSDVLTFQSNYFISHEYVNRFKDEVKRKVWQPGAKADVQVEGDSTDGHSGEATCADCWHAATANSVKGVSNTFDELGVFVSRRTVSHLLIFGYSAKYPLATISRLMETLPKGIGLGYDITCSFWSTLMRSSLGPQACELGVRMVVPAFHGHAHNRLCQLCFHIQISEGFGIEDLETCERVFSGSNAVACLTRHSTPYHRRQFIDMYLGTSPRYTGRNISDAQYTGWLSDERVEYVELLTKYGEARQIWEAAQKLSAQAMCAKDMARLCQVSQDAWDGVNFIQQELQKVDGHLDVRARWTPESPEFHCAAELFELMKANVSHTGYKQCMHISKALKACSKAIQRALQVYNKAALMLDLPWPSLTWAQIVEYTTIAEFELLHMGAWEDIQNLEWANTRNREATICHVKILHAQEEIKQLNIEIKRLATWICNETVVLDQAIEACAPTQGLLAHTLT
ncbi:hypothetical protein K439DRAFT_1614349 [Ramaria rubella]|nr:hypothetical protein K439DRAFT_1614349 [Ramaria rubella]